METKCHIFFQDPFTNTYSYGLHTDLTEHEANTIADLVPDGEEIIWIEFVDPDKDIYPHSLVPIEDN